MSTSYPGAVDTTNLVNPNTTDKRNSPSLAGQQANQNDAIKAVETKVGTGSSTPASNTLLFGTGAGTSAWQGLTSAQLAAVLSDETGSGSAVFATTPTLVTPKIDTINESTPSNGTTVGGVNFKNGALNTNNSVGTANIANGAITANKLSIGAVAATVATSETTTSTTYAGLATALAVTATIGANGLALVSISSAASHSNADLPTFMSFALSGANSLAASDANSITQRLSTATAQAKSGFTILLTGLTAGSTVFTTQYKVSANTGTFFSRSISVVPL